MEKKVGDNVFKCCINDCVFFFDSVVTIFQACLKSSIFIPRFCFHSKLSISGNCRVCLLEEKKSLKLLASCAVVVFSGMSIYTNTKLVK